MVHDIGMGIDNTNLKKVENNFSFYYIFTDTFNLLIFDF